MSVDQQFNSVLQKIREIYLFLIKGDPSPDDEIEAREQLLTSFNSLKTINPSSNLIGNINKILEDLRNWDSLELWFSETSIPKDIEDILGISGTFKAEDTEIISKEVNSNEKQKSSEPEIDLTDIFNKVSDQFKDEIENLKGKIEGLKKELDKKDQTLKSVREPKQVQKITPKREVKLPPLKIRIPVIKKPISTPPNNKPVSPETVSESEPQEIKKVKLEPVTPKIAQDQKLTPIPLKSSSNTVKETTPNLTPIPLDKFDSKPQEVHLSEEKISKTERPRIVPIVTEEDNPMTEPSRQSEEPEITTKMETPIISSVEVEEVESEEIKSSGTDLFSVFSSVGEKDESKKVDAKKKSETKLSSPPPKMKDTETVANKEPKPTAFINFAGSPQTESKAQYTSGDELSENKDTLYQELIALEGRRYSLEKSFNELGTLYNKGSIADSQYKSESDNLKTKLGEITSRIYKIRRIISSL